MGPTFGCSHISLPVARGGMMAGKSSAPIRIKNALAIKEYRLPEALRPLFGRLDRECISRV